MRVASLHYYPVKGVRAVDCEKASFDERGFTHDRRWLIVDADHQSLTQRDHAVIAQIIATPIENGLCLTLGTDSIEIPFPDDSQRSAFKVWSTTVEALDAGDAAAAWLSGILGRPARLCHMDDGAVRMTPEKWSAPVPTSFADIHPFLITTTASLDALNAAIAEKGGAPIGMERFRPNIVIEGASPWAEDQWGAVKIGDNVLDLIIPCDRCVVTTKDQKSGETMGKEPLRTLAEIHRSTDEKITGALFGWRAQPREAGVLQVGDSVEIVAMREKPFPTTSTHS